MGGFDEKFQPYFFEDSDLMVRLHLKGYKFVLVLNSIVYHMGSLTSRGTEESMIAHDTTRDIFIKKWKTTFDYFKQYSMLNGFNYNNPNIHITFNNPTNDLQNLINLLDTPTGSIHAIIDGKKFNQQDLDYLFLFPYIINNLESENTYEIGNIIIKT